MQTSTSSESLLCYKSFKQIILILITHCLVSIIIPVFCGDKKRQFNEIKPLPDAAELDGIRTQARRMPTQGSSCRMANQPGEETRPGSGWLPGKLHAPRCWGVGSHRRACNFSLSPGHRLCGFIAQPAIFTSLLGRSLRALGLSEFSFCIVSRAGRGCLSLPGGRQAPLHIVLPFLFALTNCHGLSGFRVPSAPRGDGPSAQASSLSPGSLCPSFLCSRPSPHPQSPYGELLSPVILLPCVLLSRGLKSH